MYGASPRTCDASDFCFKTYMSWSRMHVESRLNAMQMLCIRVQGLCWLATSYTEFSSCGIPALPPNPTTNPPRLLIGTATPTRRPYRATACGSGPSKGGCWLRTRGDPTSSDGIPWAVVYQRYPTVIMGPGRIQRLHPVP